MVLAPVETPPKGAAAEGAAIGRTNAAAILRHLRQHGPASAPSVGRAVGVSEVSARSHLLRMAGQGLVTKAGTRWSLTPAGTARTGPATSATDVAAAVAMLPSPAHQALARLALDAIVARYHLAGTGVDGWPSFGAWGPAGLGKTTVARVLGRLLGLDDYTHLRVVSDLDRAELLGRRVHAGGGAYRFQPAPGLGRPLLSLDELDKVRGETRGLALRLLQGDGAFMQEGERVVVKATILATFNAGRSPSDVLAEDRLRRMVHVNVAGTATPTACRASAAGLLGGDPLPVLDLAPLVPADPEADARWPFDETVAYLTAAGLGTYPSHALGLILGGRMARDGLDAEAAALAMAVDYLATAETWGGAPPGAATRFAGDFGSEAPEPASEHRRQSTGRRAPEDAPSAAVELAEAKALGARAIAAEVRELGRTEDDEGVRLRAAFAEVGRQLAHAQSVREVGHIDAVFAGLQERAERRAATIAGQRVARGQAPVVGGRRQVPDRRAIFAELLAIGSKEAPAKVLARLGLIVADGHRWRGASPATSGAAVFEGDGWADLAVRCVLLAAIAEEDASAVSERHQLGA